MKPFYLHVNFFKLSMKSFYLHVNIFKCEHTWIHRLSKNQNFKEYVAQSHLVDSSINAASRVSETALWNVCMFA